MESLTKYNTRNKFKKKEKERRKTHTHTGVTLIGASTREKTCNVKL